MGTVSAYVLPAAAALGTLVAFVRPVPGRTLLLEVASLALAGVVLLCAGALCARRRQRWAGALGRRRNGHSVPPEVRRGS